MSDALIVAACILIAAACGDHFANDGKVSEVVIDEIQKVCLKLR